MNNFIIINRTFTETTPESAEDGDFSDMGFIEEDQEVTFMELVDLMRDHQQPSMSPDPKTTDVSYYSGSYTSDYRTGTDREECIHFSGTNTPNAAKYWKWARQAADKKRQRQLQNLK